MSKHAELFDLLCELIDVQIKKYVKLATVGVGPDARLNAALVYEEVNELLGFADLLLQEMETNFESETIKKFAYVDVFDQLKFYLEQESFRGHAGWLLDDNKIHATVDERTTQFLKELEAIDEEESFDFSEKSVPRTEIQRQCQHDSYQIAHRILALAIDVSTNPDMQFDKKIPAHAQPILRKHASTRYVQYADEINSLHDECEEFLQQSTLANSSTVLENGQARDYQKAHLEQWNNLLYRYRCINTDSPLFSVEHQWHDVAVASPSPVEQPVAVQQSPTIFSNRNLALLGGLFFTGTLLACKLLPYFTASEENDLSLKQTL
ncbi:hypothetical protein BN59_00556 [Legionella massiliensis]|uniref:Uncharacterized protein n=1 Tax=Legionella massiliensis TaxID=1034943 RepID=A0A078KWY6_9GAMM|nr:hypothetical protein [Legionella massiliensis]CDZ76289.1 hypothetical protein BN59_00556 [Legionella massiliensis]CEE12027.1 hypothetical protein BN1094_00556 [Legionella massiliensis]